MGKSKKEGLKSVIDSGFLSETEITFPVLTIIGNKEMYIENFKSIMEYDSAGIKVLTKRGIVYVTGEHLDIGYLDMDEISIKGKIIQIEFQ